MASHKPLLLLVDGHSLAFRSFYAFSKGGDGGLSTKQGIPTSVTYGFLRALLDNCRGLAPAGVVVAFDTDQPTFRHVADANYKAHREEAPEHFFADLANLQTILADALDLPLCLAPGYEADDVLGTLAQRAAERGWRVRILSGDRDLFQLVDDERDIAVLYMGGGPYARSSGPTEINRQGVIAKLGVPPEDVIDLKALTGDSSDNIPGVRGVGPKTAIALLNDHGNLDGIYGALGQVRGSLRDKLETGRDNAFLSRQLAAIHLDVPLDPEPRLGLGAVKRELLAERLQGLELFSLARLVDDFTQLFSAEPPASPEAAANAPADAPANALAGDALPKAKASRRRRANAEAEAAAGEPEAGTEAGASVANRPGGLAESGVEARAGAEAGVAASGPAGSLPTAATARAGAIDSATANASAANRQAGLTGQQTTLPLSDGVGVGVGTSASAAAPPRLQPLLINTTEQLDALVRRLDACTDPAVPVALDTETTALNPFQAELVGVGLAWGAADSDLAYIPIGHSGEAAEAAPAQLELAAVLAALAPWLASERHPKTLQNAKYDRLVLLRHGLVLAGVVMDTMLADYLRDAGDGHGLEAMAQRNFGFSPTSYGDLVAKGSTFAAVPIAAAAQYCGMDVHLTWRLTGLLRQQLEALGPALLPLLAQLELPLEPVLASMEAHGIRIDSAYLAELGSDMAVQLKRLEGEAQELAGVSFNLASPKQLGELLFETLGLDRRQSRRTKTGWSTDATVLEKLREAHPVVPRLLEHRMLSKLRSTYVEALPALVEAETGRVHTDFNQAVTATGRLSSSNPNLQNIPIRTAFSRQIRKAFLPQEGWSLISADYSQIELRILTHLSGEEILVEAYGKGEDVHALTARLLLEKDDISPDERRLGKTINFGVIYGMGPQRFARETGVSQGQAKDFLNRFRERYPKVFLFLELQERLALSRGWVETILGRRRRFHFDRAGLGRLLGRAPEEIDLETARRGGLEAQQLRAAANAPIQGSSADIIKLAMVQLHNALRQQDLPAHLLLQVHDELVLEAAPEAVEAVLRLTRSTMENAVRLSVPLAVDIGVGPNWMEAK
jgi:DNA polymerase-1